MQVSLESMYSSKFFKESTAVVEKSWVNMVVQNALYMYIHTFRMYLFENFYKSFCWLR